jgi:preprotein translocase subunit YajC
MISALKNMNWTILAQNEPQAGETQPGLLDMMSGMMLPIGMIIVLYIVLMVLPQRKEQKKVQEFLSSLKKNDQVILQGGILATILNVQKDQDIVTVRIDETTNAKMRVLRSSIVKVVKGKDESESGAEKS